MPQVDKFGDEPPITRSEAQILLLELARENISTFVFIRDILDTIESGIEIMLENLETTFNMSRTELIYYINEHNSRTEREVAEVLIEYNLLKPGNSAIKTKKFVIDPYIDSEIEKMYSDKLNSSEINPFPLEAYDIYNFIVNTQKAIQSYLKITDDINSYIYNFYSRGQIEESIYSFYISLSTELQEIHIEKAENILESLVLKLSEFNN